MPCTGLALGFFCFFFYNLPFVAYTMDEVERLHNCACMDLSIPTYYVGYLFLLNCTVRHFTEQVGVGAMIFEGFFIWFLIVSFFHVLTCPLRLSLSFHLVHHREYHQGGLCGLLLWGFS